VNANNANVKNKAAVNKAGSSKADVKQWSLNERREVTPAVFDVRERWKIKEPIGDFFL
jgi:hypothetical protein